MKKTDTLQDEPMTPEQFHQSHTALPPSTPQVRGTMACGEPKPLTPILCGLPPNHKGDHSWAGAPQVPVEFEDMEHLPPYLYNTYLSSIVHNISNGEIGPLEGIEQLERLSTRNPALAQATEQRLPFVTDLKCPACGSTGTIFVGNGGYLTCSVDTCPKSDYVEALKEATELAKVEGAQEENELWTKAVQQLRVYWEERLRGLPVYAKIGIQDADYVIENYKRLRTLSKDDK